MGVAFDLPKGCSTRDAGEGKKRYERLCCAFVAGDNEEGDNRPRRTLVWAPVDMIYIVRRMLQLSFTKDRAVFPFSQNPKYLFLIHWRRIPPLSTPKWLWLWSSLSTPRHVSAKDFPHSTGESKYDEGVRTVASLAFKSVYAPEVTRLERDRRVLALYQVRWITVFRRSLDIPDARVKDTMAGLIQQAFHVCRGSRRRLTIMQRPRTDVVEDN
jgi:hypothetical protein